MPRRIVLASLFCLGVGVHLLPGAVAAGAPPTQPKVQPKQKGKLGSRYPGEDFRDYDPRYRGSQFGGGWGGGWAGGGGHHFQMPHAVTSALGGFHSFGPRGGFGGFGGPGLSLPGVGPLSPRGVVEETEEWLIFESLQGFAPGFGSWRDPLMRHLDPDWPVRELLAGLQLNPRGLSGRNPLLPGVGSDPLDPLHALGFGAVSPAGPLGDFDLSALMSPRRAGRASTMLLGPRVFDDLWAPDMLRVFDMLNRPRISMGLGGYQSQLMWMYDDPYGLGLGFGGRGGIIDPFSGGWGFPSRRGGPFGNRGWNTNPWLDPFPVFPQPRPRVVQAPPPPTREEKRAVLDKFEKSMAAVEATARVGAWGALASGLEKVATSSSLPAGVTAPLKAVRSEAAHLTDLLNVRAAVIHPWAAAPDAVVLEKHLDAVRTATGDRELADRLRRLLAVKAVWEGHDAAAAALTPTGEAPDLDAALAELRRPMLPDPSAAAPIATDDDRVLACRRVIRKTLEDIDHHLDSGRYTVALHLTDVRALRTEAGKSLRELDGTAAPKPAEGFEAVAAEVGKKLGRTLTATDRVVLRKMHAANKTVDAMVEALR